MTNICPQAPNLNRLDWRRMENYCHNLAKQGKELHISVGSHGVGGEGIQGPADKIGSGRGIVTVPSHCCKVVLVLPSRGAFPNQQTRTIGVIMPNTQEVDAKWPQYRVAVKEVEKLTGYTFWPDLPRGVGQAIKARVDDTEIRVESATKKKKKKGEK